MQAGIMCIQFQALVSKAHHRPADSYVTPHSGSCVSFAFAAGSPNQLEINSQALSDVNGGMDMCKLPSVRARGIQYESIGPNMLDAVLLGCRGFME